MTIERPTRKERVLNLLKHPESEDGWVPGPLIDSARIGGQAGTRRLRELRAEGHRIVRRARANSDSYEYRLLKDGENEQEVLAS